MRSLIYKKMQYFTEASYGHSFCETVKLDQVYMCVCLGDLLGISSVGKAFKVVNKEWT